MDQEFSVGKEPFTIIKEKIIKTNELLLLYNEKNETLAKAKHAFKQLKSKYEAALHETNRLKIENERLNYSLEILRPKYEQSEKDVNELRADYTRSDERYQQTVIESQLTILDLEEKLKHCTCEKDLLLSPSKGRAVNEKVKELKQKCKELIETERNLKNDYDNLQLKNKELKAEGLKNLRVIKDLTAKNADSQRDLTTLKTIQKMELEANNHTSLQKTVKSLEQNHEKEIHLLKMEISKLSLDNQRIKYLELECKNLKKQITNNKGGKVEKSHCSVQTEGMRYLNNSVPKQDIGIQTAIIAPMQTLKVWEDDSLDFDRVSDILNEMILPQALSPMSFASRLSESQTPPLLTMFEPLPPLDEELFVQKPIPNIVITPPTPGVEISSNSKVVFPLLTENTEKVMQPKNKMDVTRSVVEDPVIVEDTREEINQNVTNIGEIQPPKINQTNAIIDIFVEQSTSSVDNPQSCIERTYSNDTPLSSSQNKEITHGVETAVEFKHLTNTKIDDSNAVTKIDNKELPHDIKPPNRNISPTKIATDTNEIFENQSLTEQKSRNFATTDSMSTCEKCTADLELLKTQYSGSTENSKPLKISLQKDPWTLKEKITRHRKFWVPCDLNSFVKLRQKRNQIKKATVTRKYRGIWLNRPVQSDTILNALKTLKQNHINFTISNDSIPLVQPYNCYSLLTPPKPEPLTISRQFTNTFSDSLSCWNKHCTVNNTQMLLRKVPNEEEPELLGFFSIKNEVITPSTSRMAVVEKPKPFDAGDLVSQLLSGIKELVDVKRKECLSNRRKKRAKSKNRRSDFYSETETELEKLFRKSADVLGRNRRFLAAAKEQSFESNEESMFDSESDAMVDSGLVTGTPKIDSDSISFCSQNELGEGAPHNMFSPIIKHCEIAMQDDVLPSHSEDLLPPQKHNEDFAGFSLPISSSSIKSDESFKKEVSSLLDNCATPKFSACPVMISPIASSKGSPETLQGSSTPVKTLEINGNLQASPNCFKQPFFPDMISPMASSKGSPVSQAFKDNFDSFRTPICPTVLSPLALFSNTNHGKVPKKFTCTNMIGDPFPIAGKNKPADVVGFGNIGVSKPSNFDLHSLNKSMSLEILAAKKPTQDFHDNKPLCSDIKNSSVCQKITFECLSNNKDLDQSTNPSCKELPELVPKNSVTLININSEDETDISKYSSLLLTSDIQEGTTKHLKVSNSSNLEQNKLIQTKVAKLNCLEKPDESSLHIDLTIKSTDLNCTLEDISISQLELSSATTNILSEPLKISVNESYSSKNCSDCKQTCKPIKRKRSNGSANPERRCSLRRTSQSEVRNCDNESKKIVSPEAESSADFTSPRTRAAKRKLEEDLYKKEKQIGTVTRSSKLAEHKEVATPLKKKRGRPRKVDKKTEPSADNSLNDSKSLKVPLENISSQDHEEISGNSQEIVCSNAEGEGNDSFKSNPKQDTDISEISEGKGQLRKTKKLLRKRSSKSIDEDISQDLFDWLKGRDNTDPKTSKNMQDSESFEQRTEDTVRQEKKQITLTEAVSTGDLDYFKGVETTQSEGSRSGHRPRKITSKEFISESESECDISSENYTETSYSTRVGKLGKKNITILEKKQSNGNDINSQDSTLEENDMSANKKTLKQSAFIKNDNQIRKEATLASDSESQRVQSNNSSNQAVTSEIQHILRNLSKETGQNKNIFVLNDFNRGQRNNVAKARSDACCPSEKDLFGDVSDSEDETCDSNNKDLKVTKKSNTKKVTGKNNLKKKMLKQVKGTVYASTKNNGCDIVKKSCDGKPVDVLSNDGVLEKNCLKSMPATENEDRKINIVQNILISKGLAFNLLPNHSKNEQPSTSATSLKNVDDSRPLPEEPPKSDPRKTIKLEQNISKMGTPVDILSQVMQGMIKTGPKMSRKNASSFMPSKQGRQHNLINSVSTNGIHENVKKSWRVEKKFAEGNTVNTNNVDEYLDCPKSPDVIEIPDRLPRLIPTEKPERLQGSKVRTLIDKLMVFSNEEKMLDDVIKEFAFQDMTFMAEIIVDKLSHDFHDKADNLFQPSPPMTSTQRTLLGFLLKLDRSTHPGIEEKFFSLAELRVFNKYTCTLEIVQPITRLYTALCKLRYDLNRIRRFICEGFYFIGELAVPMLFTVLTMWPDVLPMESASSDHLLAKILIQVCYLKECNQPGYNLLPLRDLLKKYYGYPTERWNCEDIFKEIMVEYIRNPSIRLSDLTLLLFLKNKPTKWVYQKVKETVIPLYNQASESNPNLKATLVILLANICCSFKQYEEYDWSVILEMDKWFIDLDRDDLDPIIKRAIHLARARLPRRIRKRNKGANKKNIDKAENEDNLDSLKSSCEIIQNSADLTVEEIKEENCQKTNFEHTKEKSSKEEISESTNNVNIDARLESSSETKGGFNIELLNNSLSCDEESDSASSSSDIEF